MQLMGDFKDVCGSVLDDNGQKDLATRCLAFIERIHKAHPETKNVLITTDSMKFAEEAKKMNYVFVVPGKIGHIGYSDDYEVHLKMIIDFLLISKAKKAYMGYSGEMYKSHFAESAAEITGIPYENIHF